MPSIWNAGIQAFDQVLADRARARDEELERQRRADLDREQSEYRNATLDMQRRQMANTEARQWSADMENRLAREREDEKSDRVKKFIAIASDPSQSEDIRRQAAAQLLADGVSGATVSAGLGIGAKPKTVKRQILDHRGKLVREIEAEEGTSFQTLPEPDRGPQIPVSHRDNPNLPQGTQDWINSLAQRRIPLAKARQELSQGWPLQKRAHPSVDLGLAAKYLDSLYPNGVNLFGVDPNELPVESRPEGFIPNPPGPGEAPPPPAPVVRGPGSVTDEQMSRGMGLGGSPAPRPQAAAMGAPMPVVPPQATALITDEMAIAALRAKGREITPESIEMAKQILASQAR